MFCGWCVLYSFWYCDMMSRLCIEQNLQRLNQYCVYIRVHVICLNSKIVLLLVIHWCIAQAYRHRRNAEWGGAVLVPPPPPSPSCEFPSANIRVRVSVFGQQPFLFILKYFACKECPLTVSLYIAYHQVILKYRIFFLFFWGGGEGRLKIQWQTPSSPIEFSGADGEENIQGSDHNPHPEICSHTPRLTDENGGGSLVLDIIIQVGDAEGLGAGADTAQHLTEENPADLPHQRPGLSLLGCVTLPSLCARRKSRQKEIGIKGG